MTCYNFCHPGNVAGSVYISGTTCFDGVGAFYLNNGDCICIDLDEPYQTCDNPVLQPGCACEGDECCFQQSGQTAFFNSVAMSEVDFITDDLLYIGGSRLGSFDGQPAGTGGMIIPTCGGYTGATAVNLRCTVPGRGVTESYQIYPTLNGKYIVRSGVNISRINSDFSTDNTFNSVFVLGGNSDGMTGMYVNPSGESYIMGVFGSGVRDCSGVTSNFNTNIYKIGVNGGVDTSYSGVSITGVDFVGEREGRISTETDLNGEALVVRVSGFTGNTIYSPIMKLQADGTPDPTFDNSLFRGISGASRNQIGGSYIQRDGKYLVYGSFTNLSGITGLNRMVRINPDGTLDPSFSFSFPFPYPEEVIDVEQDLFQNYHIVGARGGPTYSYLSLTKNGTFRFNILTNQAPSTFLGNSVACGECEVFIGGSPTPFFSGATPYRTFLKFDLNGNLNMCVYDCFSGTGTNTFGTVNSMLIDNQNTNLIAVLGVFTSLNGVSRQTMARMQSDGQVDLTFNPGTGFNTSTVSPYGNEFIQQSDGKYIVVGNFTTYNATARNRIVRINYNGTLDTSFVIGSGFSRTPYDVIMDNNKIVVCGTGDNTYSGTNVGFVCRLNSDGSLDSTFANNSITGVSTDFAIKIHRNDDGTYYLGGKFSFGGRRGLIKLNSDGTYASTDPFNTSGVGFEAGARINDFEVLPDGKIIAVGGFGNYNGVAVPLRMIRINPNGTRDTTFASGSYNNDQYEVIVQGTKYISVGVATLYSGITINQITRINDNGSYDSTWNSLNFTTTGGGVEDSIQHLLQLPNGFIFCAGFFDSYDGNLTNNIVKMNQNGIYFDCDPVPITPTPSVTPTMTRTPTMTPTSTATPSVTPSVTQTATPSVTPSITPSATCNGQCRTYTFTKISTFLSQAQIDYTDCYGNPQSQILESPPVSYPESVVVCALCGTLSYDAAQIDVVDNGDCVPATPTVTPTMTQTQTPSMTATQTETPSATPTSTPTIGLSPTQTPSQTATPSETPTNTPSETPTNTPTESPTNTPSQTQTQTPSATNDTPPVSPTQTPSPTSTPPAYVCYYFQNEDSIQSIIYYYGIFAGSTSEVLGSGDAVQRCVDPNQFAPYYTGGVTTIGPCSSATSCTDDGICEGCT